MPCAASTTAPWRSKKCGAFCRWPRSTTRLPGGGGGDGGGGGVGGDGGGGGLRRGGLGVLRCLEG